ncbi:hypothetical protein [Georgenia muralis]
MFLSAVGVLLFFRIPDEVLRWFVLAGMVALGASWLPVPWLVYVRVFVDPAIAITGTLATLTLTAMPAPSPAERTAEQFTALLISLAGFAGAKGIAASRMHRDERAQAQLDLDLAAERHRALLAATQAAHSIAAPNTGLPVSGISRSRRTVQVAALVGTIIVAGVAPAVRAAGRRESTL